MKLRFQALLNSDLYLLMSQGASMKFFFTYLHLEMIKPKIFFLFSLNLPISLRQDHLCYFRKTTNFTHLKSFYSVHYHHFDPDHHHDQLLRLKLLTLPALPHSHHLGRHTYWWAILRPTRIYRILNFVKFWSTFYSSGYVISILSFGFFLCLWQIIFWIIIRFLNARTFLTFYKRLQLNRFWHLKLCPCSSLWDPRGSIYWWLGKWGLSRC